MVVVFNMRSLIEGEQTQSNDETEQSPGEKLWLGGVGRGRLSFPWGWRPFGWLWKVPICATLILVPQVFEIVLCYFIWASSCPLLLFSNFPDCPPPSTLHKCRLHDSFLPHRLLSPSLKTTTPINKSPRPRMHTVWRNLHTHKETGLRICLQVGGLSSERRLDTAAVRREIVSAYLASTTKEESPSLGWQGS